MPIEPGKSQKTISLNIKELIKSKAGKARAKGIRTLARKRNISLKKAKKLQAKAISYTKAERS